MLKQGIGDFFKPRRIFKKSNLLIEAAKLFGKEVSVNEAEDLINISDSKFWSDSNDIVEVYKEEPIFEGQFSNESYKERVHEAIDNFNEQINMIEKSKIEKLRIFKINQNVTKSVVNNSFKELNIGGFCRTSIASSIVFVEPFFAKLYKIRTRDAAIA